MLPIVRHKRSANGNHSEIVTLARKAVIKMTGACTAETVEKFELSYTVGRM